MYALAKRTHTEPFSALMCFNKVYNYLKPLLLLLFDAACVLQRQSLGKFQLGISCISAERRKLTCA